MSKRQEAVRRIGPYGELRLVNRNQRFMQCHYICEPCQTEWMDEMVTAGASWCPCCEASLGPYSVVEIEEERWEFSDEDGED